MTTDEWEKLFDRFERMKIEWRSGISFWGSLRAEILEQYGEGARGQYSFSSRNNGLVTSFHGKLKTAWFVLWMGNPVEPMQVYTSRPLNRIRLFVVDGTTLNLLT